MMTAAVGCQPGTAPPAPKQAEPALATSAPLAQPAQKTEPKPADAKPAAAAVTPKVNRLVMGVGTIGIESNDPTEISPPETWQLRPMYENLLGVDPDGKDRKSTRLNSSHT